MDLLEHRSSHSSAVASRKVPPRPPLRSFQTPPAPASLDVGPGSQAGGPRRAEDGADAQRVDLNFQLMQTVNSVLFTPLGGGFFLFFFCSWKDSKPHRNFQTRKSHQISVPAEVEVPSCDSLTSAAGRRLWSLGFDDVLGSHPGSTLFPPGQKVREEGKQPLPVSGGAKSPSGLLRFSKCEYTSDMTVPKLGHKATITLASQRSPVLTADSRHEQLLPGPPTVRSVHPPPPATASDKWGQCVPLVDGVHRPSSSH